MIMLILLLKSKINQLIFKIFMLKIRLFLIILKLLEK